MEPVTVVAEEGVKPLAPVATVKVSLVILLVPVPVAPMVKAPVVILEFETVAELDATTVPVPVLPLIVTLSITKVLPVNVQFPVDLMITLAALGSVTRIVTTEEPAVP